MDRDKIAFFTGTPSDCLKVYNNTKNEQVFSSTMKWLKSGGCKFKYVIWDFDQWVGYDFLEIDEERVEGEWYTRIFNEVRL